MLACMDVAWVDMIASNVLNCEDAARLFGA